LREPERKRKKGSLKQKGPSLKSNELRERQLELEREAKARQFELDQKERELQIEQERAKLLAEREYEQHTQEMEKLDFQARLREREAKEREGKEKQNDGNIETVPDSPESLDPPSDTRPPSPPKMQKAPYCPQRPGNPPSQTTTQVTLEKLWVRFRRCRTLMKSETSWIATSDVLSVSLKLRSGSVSIWLCTSLHS